MAAQFGALGVVLQQRGLVMGKEKLANRGEVQRRPTTDGAHHLHARTFTEDPLDVDDFVALPQREVDRLPGQLVQGPHGLQRRIPDIQTILDEIAEFEQPQAQPICPGLGSLDQPACDKIIQDAMGGGGVQAGVLADGLQRQRLLVQREQVQHCKCPCEHLHRRGSRGIALHAVDFHPRCDRAAAGLGLARAAASPDCTAPSSVAGYGPST